MMNYLTSVYNWCMSYKETNGEKRYVVLKIKRDTIEYYHKNYKD